jgi:hypothetical protein
VNITTSDLAYDGHILAASATSARRRAALRKHSVGADFAPSTGEVRLLTGAFAMAAGTPTVDIQDLARVRSWSPPV